MNSDKLMLPEISDQLARLIETARIEKNYDLFFLAKQNSQGLICSIPKYTTGKEEDLLEAFAPLEKGDIILFCRHKQPLKTTDKEEEFAHFLAHKGIGFALVHPSGHRLRLLTEAFVSGEHIRLLDPEDIAQPLQQGGALSRIIPHYEPRRTQIDLLKFITRCFNENNIGIAEGGTGVGKSFAYLIPSIQWAEINHERIVISTATIALQQQLLNKDIPLVKKILKSRIKAALIKGKQNYLCLHHLFEILEEEKIFLQESDPLLKISEWAEETKSGDKADLPFPVPEDLWSRISGDTETCPGAKCPHYQKCFIFKARKDAAQAQLLIVNHHLFFADMLLRNQIENAALGILPPFRKIIFDEAHHIESSAVHFFSDFFSRYSIQRQISRLLRRRGRRETGLLTQITTELPASEYHDACIEKTRQALEELHNANENLHEKSRNLGDYSFRLYQKTPTHILSLLMPLLEKLSFSLSALTELLKNLYHILDRISVNMELLTDLRLCLKRLSQSAELCQKFVQYKQYPNQIFWAEQRKNRLQEIYYVYICTPLNITTIFDQYLYQQKYSVLMLSATLTLNQKFDYFLQKIGLGNTERRYACAEFPSPFNYQRRCLFCIAKDIPSIENTSSFHAYSYRLILDLIEKNPHAGILILFTSYKSLHDCAEYLYPELEKTGRRLFKQGDNDRAKLIEDFIKYKPAVLLGTDSFWEGIDIDNSALKILIIFRLPFQPPNNPLIQAKQELLEKQGKNPFMELQVPDAVIKFKQGFGRLMRKSSDFGVIILLDNRIIKKQYGELFLQSLPKVRCENLEYHALLEEISEFLKQDFSQIPLS